VVASDLFEIRRFNAEHGDIIAIAKDGAEFAGAIGAQLKMSGLAEVARRVEVARGNSWASRIAQMSALIGEAAAERAGQDEGWDARLKRAYRRARQRTLQAVLGAVALYLLLFQTPLVWLVASPLKMSMTPASADGIVVFAGGVGESGKAGGGYQERVKEAVDLYKAGYANRMIFSSGFVFAFPEAEIMRSLAVSNGVPPSAIQLETHAANTHENVLLTRAIAESNGWHHVLLVSSPYHMRRAVLTWHRVAPGVEVTPTPVPVSQFYAHAYGASLDQIRGIAQEYAAIVIYWWRGWI
jgi:uncharacterized SAM-binding protein YcdF (DUF218 family)